MPLLHLALLALVQGVTEFLPISSSAHLILLPQATGDVDQGLVIDLALHVGTLAAVILYFRREAGMIARGVVKWLRGDRADPEARLAFLLGLSTIPVVVAGVAIAASGLADAFRSVAVIAWTTLVWGIALWAADRLCSTRRTFEQWGLRDALVMGFAQALSLVPGTSRSGITMTAARALGYDRVDGARLALLMAMPATFAAGAYGAVDLVRTGNAALGLDAAIAAGLAFIAALVTLVGLMRMLRVWTMTPFALYRIALGAVLLWIAYG